MANVVFKIALSFIFTLACVPKVFAQSPGFKIDSSGKRRSQCYMPPAEFKAKLAGVRRAVGCEFNQYNAFQCASTLGLAAAGAAGAAGVGIAKMIRNPAAKMCSIATGGPSVPAFETSISEALISLFWAPPAFAASCPAEIDFLKRDLDFAVNDHMRNIDGVIKQQSLELEKLRAEKSRLEADLKKQLGIDPKARVELSDLQGKVEVELHRKAPGPDPIAVQREQGRLKLRQNYFELRARGEKLAKMRSQLNAPADLAQQLKTNNEAMKAAETTYYSKFSSRAEEELFRYKHFITVADNNIRVREAQIAKQTSPVRKQILQQDLSRLKARITEYRGATERLQSAKGGSELYARVYQTAANPHIAKQDALRAAYDKLDRASSLESTMKANMSKMTQARFAWQNGKFGFGRKGVAGLEDMRQALHGLRSEGKALGHMEGRFVSLELRSTAEAMRQGGSRLGRSIGVKGLKVIGAGVLTGGWSAVAFAADFAMSAEQLGCGTLHPFYLSQNENCSNNYAINSSNADVLFSDTLSSKLQNEDDEFHCFVKKNWEERFAKWKFTCKPTSKDSGMFKTKIYGKRADGEQFYFAQTADPKMISASITNQKYMTQALEASTCCMDSNPRISDRECANYGIAMAPRSPVIQAGKNLGPAKSAGATR